MKMSPTPWKTEVDYRGDWSVLDANGRRVALLCKTQAEADARFIVAAVNAADGTPVEVLEDPDA